MKIIVDIFKILNKILCSFSFLYDLIVNVLYIRMNGVDCKKTPKIKGRIFIKNKGYIKIGTGVLVNSNVKSNPIGGDFKTVIVCTENAIIKIGNGTGISNSCIHAQQEIQIGNNVLIGGGCKIYDTDFHNLDHRFRRIGVSEEGVIVKKVIIGDNVFIGAHSLILKGVII